MSTHDYAIANASGATVRADINNALAAIVSNNSSATAPSPTFAYMWWADTTASALKQRNAANTGWITLFTFDWTNGLLRIDLDEGADIASATTTDIGAATGNSVTVTGTTTITGLGTIKAGVWRLVTFAGALTLTHNPTSLILPGGADITTAAGDSMWALSLGSGNWRVPFYQAAAISPVVGAPISITHSPPGISNNATDPTDSIDIAVGKCRDDADTANLEVTVAIGKDISATWASGGTPATPTGGMSSSLFGAGAPVNDTTYNVILGLVAGVEEVGIDTSVTGANLVTDHSFTNPRLIGSFLRETAANRLFTQDGDEFLWDASFQDYNVANPGTSAVLRPLKVPTGRKVRAIHTIDARTTSLNAEFAALMTSPDQADTVPALTGPHDVVIRESANQPAVNTTTRTVRTDTSGQIRTRLSNSTATDSIAGTTHGYIDRRGRDG